MELSWGEWRQLILMGNGIIIPRHNLMFKTCETPIEYSREKLVYKNIEISISTNLTTHTFNLTDRMTGMLWVLKPR